MSRGKWKTTILKAQIRTALLEAKILEMAAEQVKIKLHKRKPLEESLKEHIGKMIDRIDPIEAIAVGSATYLIHGIILNNSDLLKAAEQWISNEPLSGIQAIWGYLQPQINAPDVPIEKPDSIELWFWSFLIAFIIVRHGAEILGSLTGLTKFIGGFLS